MLRHLSRVQLFATLWTVAHQAPLSMGFFRQEYWNGLPFPSLDDLPGPGIKPGSPALQAGSSPLSHQGSRNCIVVISEVEICTLVCVCVCVCVCWGREVNCGGRVKEAIFLVWKMEEKSWTKEWSRTLEARTCRETNSPKKKHDPYIKKYTPDTLILAQWDTNQPSDLKTIR